MSVLRFGLYLGLIACLSGCATTGRDGALLDVPFHRQRAGFCGIDALAMVLGYYGTVPDERVLAEAYVPALRGTIPDLLVEAAGRVALPGRVARGDMTDLAGWVRRDIPPIVLLDVRRRSGVGHYVVVTGISHDGQWVRVHSGRRPNRWWRQSRFEKQWQAAGGLAVLIESGRGNGPRRVPAAGAGPR